MADKTYTEAQLSDWEETITSMRYQGVRLDPGDEHEAVRAISNMASEWGLYFHLPAPIATIAEMALQIGYASALGDVRAGEIGGLGEIED